MGGLWEDDDNVLNDRNEGCQTVNILKLLSCTFWADDSYGISVIAHKFLPVKQSIYKWLLKNMVLALGYL